MAIGISAPDPRTSIPLCGVEGCTTCPTVQALIDREPARPYRIDEITTRAASSARSISPLGAYDVPGSVGVSPSYPSSGGIAPSSPDYGTFTVPGVIPGVTSSATPDFTIPRSYDDMVVGRSVSREIRVQAMRTAAYIMAEQEVVLLDSNGEPIDDDAELVTHAAKFRILWKFLACLLVGGSSD